MEFEYDLRELEKLYNLEILEIDRSDYIGKLHNLHISDFVYINTDTKKIIFYKGHKYEFTYGPYLEYDRKYYNLLGKEKFYKELELLVNSKLIVDKIEGEESQYPLSLIIDNNKYYSNTLEIIEGIEEYTTTEEIHELIYKESTFISFSDAKFKINYRLINGKYDQDLDPPSLRKDRKVPYPIYRFYNELRDYIENKRNEKRHLEYIENVPVNRIVVKEVANSDLDEFYVSISDLYSTTEEKKRKFELLIDDIPFKKVLTNMMKHIDRMIYNVEYEIKTIKSYLLNTFEEYLLYYGIKFETMKDYYKNQYSLTNFLSLNDNSTDYFRFLRSKYKDLHRLYRDDPNWIGKLLDNMKYYDYLIDKLHALDKQLRDINEFKNIFKNVIRISIEEGKDSEILKITIIEYMQDYLLYIDKLIKLYLMRAKNRFDNFENKLQEKFIKKIKENFEMAKARRLDTLLNLDIIKVKNYNQKIKKHKNSVIALLYVLANKETELVQEMVELDYRVMEPLEEAKPVNIANTVSDFMTSFY